MIDNYVTLHTGMTSFRGRVYFRHGGKNEPESIDYDMTSMRTGQRSLVMKSLIVLAYAWAGLCACLAGYFKYTYASR